MWKFSEFATTMSLDLWETVLKLFEEFEELGWAVLAI
jgi:hypothetical protein